MAKRAALAVIEKVAAEGIAAIEAGEYTLIKGREGSKALLERVNEAAVARRTARDR